jgi:16S rRNA (cytosine1402-N4)-methyltransferase
MLGMMYNINMATIPYQHEPAMAGEVLEYLKPAAGKIFVDATLGGGGHTAALTGKVFAFDQDAEAIAAAKQKLSAHKNITYIHDNFASLKKHIKEKVDGVLFDLGVSSYQIDEPSRGFSLQKDGPLDMRMDQRQKLTAFDIVNTWPAEELARIFREYGEERFAKRIGNAICLTRNAKKIQTTFELKEIIENAIPTWRKRESVARVFQSLRITVNSELENLEKALNDAVSILKPGGRIVVLSYHSLEDRIVKRTFRKFKGDGILEVLTKKPVGPSEEESRKNPRARSAKLRAGEKM